MLLSPSSMAGGSIRSYRRYPDPHRDKKKHAHHESDRENRDPGEGLNPGFMLDEKHVADDPEPALNGPGDAFSLTLMGEPDHSQGLEAIQRSLHRPSHWDVHYPWCIPLRSDLHPG